MSTALETLKGMFCDPAGDCSYHIPDEDRRIVGEAMTQLETELAAVRAELADAKDSEQRAWKSRDEILAAAIVAAKGVKKNDGAKSSDPEIPAVPSNPALRGLEAERDALAAQLADASGSLKNWIEKNAGDSVEIGRLTEQLAERDATVAGLREALLDAQPCAIAWVHYYAGGRALHHEHTKILANISAALASAPTASA